MDYYKSLGETFIQHCFTDDDDLEHAAKMSFTKNPNPSIKLTQADREEAYNLSRTMIGRGMYFNKAKGYITSGVAKKITASDGRIAYLYDGLYFTGKYATEWLSRYLTALDSVRNKKALKGS